jgi:hypothetical protein
MAFPGTYNISYYRGDTLEFRVYPKTSSGSAFNLEDYLVKFTLASQRGSDPELTRISAFAEKQGDGSILCAITPSNGAAMTAPSYVYDVEIFKPQEVGDSYPIIHTILTGSVSITEQVTQEYSV